MTTRLTLDERLDEAQAGTGRDLRARDVVPTLVKIALFDRRQALGRGAVGTGLVEPPRAQRLPGATDDVEGGSRRAAVVDAEVVAGKEIGMEFYGVARQPTLDAFDVAVRELEDMTPFMRRDRQHRQLAGCNTQTSREHAEPEGDRAVRVRIPSIR